MCLPNTRAKVGIDKKISPNEQLRHTDATNPRNTKSRVGGHPSVTRARQSSGNLSSDYPSILPDILLLFLLVVFERYHSEEGDLLNPLQNKIR